LQKFIDWNFVSFPHCAGPGQPLLSLNPIRNFLYKFPFLVGHFSLLAFCEYSPLPFKTSPGPIRLVFPPFLRRESLDLQKLFLARADFWFFSKLPKTPVSNSFWGQGPFRFPLEREMGLSETGTNPLFFQERTHLPLGTG